MWYMSNIYKQQEKHNDYENINNMMYKFADLRGFLLEPIVLGEVFYRILQEKSKSDKNIQTANNMLKVFSILCQFNYINGKKYKNHKGFSVSPKIWKINCVGRSALETSIKHLKDINLIDYENSCYKGQASRRKRFYSINLFKLDILYIDALRIKDGDSEWLF